MLTYYPISSFVDEIIKQHMINLKNRVFNYDWINEEFAKSLRLYDDEVAVYRKHMAIKGIALGTILDAPPELAKALPKKKREVSHFWIFIYSFNIYK